ncbi:MAG: class I SAM-dependent methyltransferase [Dehalococcoidales bacterium]|nr:class I SAM-dependent methyltransferase [Dehalococcoidales bacterium]
MGNDFTGWFSPSEMDILSNLVGKHARPGMLAVEVGSWKGRSSSAIASIVKAVGGLLYCVDHFKGSPSTPEWDPGSDVGIFSVFATNVKDMGLWPCIKVMFMPSRDAAAVFADGVADVLFLDATHKYASVLEDIKLWLPKVKKGGLVCGHDCECRPTDPNFLKMVKSHSDTEVKEADMLCINEMNWGCHPGVVLAVPEVFGDDYEITDIRLGAIWHTVKR